MDTSLRTCGCSLGIGPKRALGRSDAIELLAAGFGAFLDKAREPEVQRMSLIAGFGVRRD